jgi:dihydrofolate reductase
MRRITVFNQVSLDGYFVDRNGEMNWAYRPAEDAEWNEFVATNASGGGVLLFGRVTYEMMASYWPTPMAMEHNPAVAKGMNRMAKIAFSRTLKKPSWENTTVAKGELLTAVRNLKKEPGDDMAILGSGSIVAQLASAGLIDEFQIVVNPIVLGGGRTLFDGVRRPLSLTLTRSRAFRNGNTLLCYQPA